MCVKSEKTIKFFFRYSKINKNTHIFLYFTLFSEKISVTSNFVRLVVTVFSYINFWRTPQALNNGRKAEETI